MTAHTQLKTIRNWEFAKLMNHLEPDYHTYEYSDMLKVFSKALQEALKNADTNVQLEGFANIWLEVQERKGHSPLTKNTEGKRAIFKILRIKASRVFTDKMRLLTILPENIKLKSETKPMRPIGVTNKEQDAKD